MPTVARRENLTMVAVGHPQFDEGRAKQRRHIKYDCCVLNVPDILQCSSGQCDVFEGMLLRTTAHS